MQLPDGTFIELFDSGHHADDPAPTGGFISYTHIALVVEDIFAAEQALKEAGVPIDTPPCLGLEQTWQMWSHDPDGNRIEFMQYTPKSWQRIGK